MSIDRIRACAWGLRSALPTSMFGRCTSAPEARATGHLVDTIGPHRPGSNPSSVAVRLPLRASSHRSASSNFVRRIQDGAHNLVITGAAAQITGEPVSDLDLRRIGVAIEQRFRGHQESRSAYSALERCVLEKLRLQRVQPVPAGHSLDGLDRLRLRLHPEHQACAHEASIDDDAASAAVAGCASLLAPGQMQFVSENVEQGLLDVAEKLDRVAI